MYDRELRARALAMVAAGASQNAVSKQLGISRAAIRDWLRSPEPKHHARRVKPDLESLDPWAYSHLLGLYLGDGHIARMRRDVYQLRITCDDKYPRIIAEATLSMHRIRPIARIFLSPGPKHARRIVLAAWQRRIVLAEPERFLRGLFHSDGCRFTNWTTRTVAGRTKRYEYPRYLFSNRSTDILALCTWALDLVGIAWRKSRRDCISVARHEAVAAMDEFVGPKTEVSVPRHCSKPG